jgi:glutaredoxin
VEDKRLKVEVYFAPNCPTKEQVERNLKEALKMEGIPAELTIEVLDPAEAEKRGFRGSPTIIINGETFQPLEMGGFS